MCFIIQEEKDTVSKTGIVLSVDPKRKTGIGTIHCLNAEVTCPHCIEQFNRKDLAEGDRVLFSRYVAEQVDYDGDGLKGKIVWAVPLDAVLAKIHD